MGLLKANANILLFYVKDDFGDDDFKIDRAVKWRMRQFAVVYASDGSPYRENSKNSANLRDYSYEFSSRSLSYGTECGSRWRRTRINHDQRLLFSAAAVKRIKSLHRIVV